MLNTARYSTLDDAFGQLLRGFVVRPVVGAAVGATPAEGNETTAKFRTDIAENDKAYILYAELPGVKKEDIQIAIDGDQVSISAETSAEKVEKDGIAGERVLRTERYSGKYFRAFALGTALDEDGANARFADGVLTLTLPKKATAAVKRVTIQ
jgi:HSP20 family protein